MNLLICLVFSQTLISLTPLLIVLTALPHLDPEIVFFTKLSQTTSTVKILRFPTIHLLISLIPLFVKSHFGDF